MRCDSDFVSRDPEFTSLADTIMQSILNSAGSSPVTHQSRFSSDKNIEEKICYYRTKFRENIGIESSHLIEVEPSKSQAIGHYIHQRLGNNTGKIGSLVKVESEYITNPSSLEEIGNYLSRQIVALSDPEVNVAKLLNSEYLFAPIGTVRKFIEQYEEKLKCKIAVLDMAYVKIK